ncbi:TPA: TonB-dependent receptor [Candidatus Poribacteria bacterium]|nr:TonB-dependent receptor [Candidatus Poribacteria bacterium]
MVSARKEPRTVLFPFSIPHFLSAIPRFLFYVFCLLPLLIGGWRLPSPAYTEDAPENMGDILKQGRPQPLTARHLMQRHLNRADIPEDSDLQGIVQDGRTRRPLPYTLVRILEVEKRAVTDRDGRFTFQRLPFGHYTLLVRKAGYSPLRLPIDHGPQTPQPIIISLTPVSGDLSKLKSRIYGLGPIITASRKEQSADRVPQNLTVLSKNSIEDLPAHNLGGALNHVPGLSVQISGGPGNIAYPMVQGSEYRHLLVMIDGIPLNTETEGLADISQIPLENIGRIEIQKGAASAAWGSSLGGVINVLTQSPSRGMGGRLSFGERNTISYSARISDTMDDIGYLVALRRLKTDGFRPKNDYQGDHLFVKMEANISDLSKVSASIGYDNSKGAGDEFMDLGYRTYYRRRNSYGALRLTRILTRRTSLELSVTRIRQRYRILLYQLGSEDLLSSVGLKEERLGIGLKTSVTVGHLNTVTAGLDLFWTGLKSETVGGARDVSRRAIWFNDELDSGDFTLLFGGRFDYASAYGSQFSPNIGVVYRLPGWKTVLRSVLVRGFNAPPLSFKYYEDPARGRVANPGIRPERVWSYQIGLENGYLSWLWVKFGLYRSNISDAVETVIDRVKKTAKKENIGRVRCLGGELELRAEPVSGFSLSVGGSFNDVRDLRTKRVIKGRPRVTYDVGLAYEGGAGFRANLKGRYVWWNQPPELGAKDRRFVWDLKLSRKWARTPLESLKATLSVHNIFDTRSAWTYRYPLPGRWIEGEVSISL